MAEGSGRRQQTAGKPQITIAWWCGSFFNSACRSANCCKTRVVHAMHGTGMHRVCRLLHNKVLYNLYIWTSGEPRNQMRRGRDFRLAPFGGSMLEI